MTHAEVATVLREQVKLYGLLVRLCAVQHAHVEAGDTDALVTLLDKRNAIMARLLLLEAQVKPAKQEWPRLKTEWPADGAREVEALFGEARALLAQINAADTDDALVLQQRKIGVARQLAGAAGAARGLRGYAGALGARPAGLNVAR